MVSMHNERSMCALPLVWCRVLLLSALLAACRPEAGVIPSGYVDLEFSGTTGSSANFKLTNLSNQDIYIRATTSGSVDIEPLDYMIFCAGTGSELYDQFASPLVDGQTSVKKITPGKRIYLKLQGDFLLQHRVGLCHLRAILLGGTFIESKSFEVK